jgi:hypothetical protein
MPGAPGVSERNVERDELQSAISPNSSVFNGARVLGPGIAVTTPALGWRWAQRHQLYRVDQPGDVDVCTCTPAAVCPASRCGTSSRTGCATRRASRKAFRRCRYCTAFGYNFALRCYPLCAELGAVGFEAETAMGIGSLVGALGAVRLAPTQRTLLIAAGSWGLLLLSRPSLVHPDAATLVKRRREVTYRR